MLRIHEKQRWIYASFFLFVFTFCRNTLGAGECPINLKRLYGNEHDFLAACREGNLDAVQYFLNLEGFDISKQFISGVSGYPVHGLYLAVKDGHTELVHMLAEARSVLDQPASDGDTPLYRAVQDGRTDLVQILVDAGAKLDQPIREGDTPLCRAAQEGYADIVQILVGAGAKPNQRAKDSATPLFLAAQNTHDEVVKILLGGGADPSLKWHFDGLFAKSPLTAAKCSKPLLRFKNPAKYERCTAIIHALKQASRKLQAYQPVATHSPTEETPLLNSLSTLSLPNDSK
ncbi:ankyrin repeat domain-containing protein [Sansalvadorimonas verongulae]|uniref:ankyrin repeat domain-containing protein n=1 Tax=Sansalvadorimonas verongulae TaxID=2172824 RepID=UPI0012BCCBB8|nr:ankyrin repeat domain-containing protein [Sansalvadorimonas verongulae]MTI12021.1 ankyrin repeat domain-containing protein [Sansalvadorimonas verongulae]